MSNIKKLRDKILTIKNVQKITKAMEMVAISKIRRAQIKMNNTIPYYNSILRVINNVCSRKLKYNHIFLKEREIKRVGYIVVTTDKGLAGSLNNSLIKRLLLDIEKWQNKNVHVNLILIGTKAISFFKSMKFKILYNIFGLNNNINVTDLDELLSFTINFYNDCYLDRIYIINNKFINIINQIPQVLQILPIKLKKETILDKYWDYIYEPNSDYVLDILLKKYVKYYIYYNIVENLVSEQAARMIAMKSASDNCSNLVEKLKIMSNHIRQNNITKEINEIVAGSSLI